MADINKNMPQLEKRISLYGLTMIAAGSCIGSGIFRAPSETAQYLPYDAWVLFAWLLVGIIMLAGALSISELGGMYPQSGGVYVFLRHAYGDAAAFLYGWGVLTIVTSGAIAALSLVFSSYVSSVIEMSEHGKIYLSLAVIIILSVLNVFGVKVGNTLASIITSGKLLGIGAVIIIGLVLGSETVDFSFTVGNFQSLNTTSNGFISALGLACIGAYFSYGGFHHASYLAGEVKNAQRNLPRAMTLGMLIVIFVYVLINFSYLRLLSVEAMAGTDKVASTAISVVWKGGGLFIACLIALSTLGTISIYTMSAPRLYFALANDGLFFKKLATIHPTYKTPANAILLQCAIACILLLWWQTFAKAVDYIVFLDYIFMGMAVYAVVVLRKKFPNAIRPYKTLWYPAVPLLFVIFTGYVLINSMIEKPEIATVCTAFMAVGFVVYYFFKMQRKVT